jgi:hypothetical protein
VVKQSKQKTKKQKQKHKERKGGGINIIIKQPSCVFGFFPNFNSFISNKYK